MLNTGEDVSTRRALSERDATYLCVEVVDGRFVRLRVENADLQTTTLLTREEAEWLGNTLIARVAGLAAAGVGVSPGGS